MVKLKEIITEITPAGGVPNKGEPTIRYEYDRVNWENVDDSDVVGDEQIVAWGGYPGAYDTVDASGVEAATAYFDSSISDANLVFVTNDGAFVFDFVADQIRESTLASEVASVLRSLSRMDVIEGLRTADDIAPPHTLLYEHMEFHNDIKVSEIKQCNGLLLCRVVLIEDRDPNTLLEELRTICGVQYSKPDDIEIVESLE